MEVFVTEMDVVVFGDVCNQIWSVVAPAMPSHTIEGGRLITREDHSPFPLLTTGEFGGLLGLSGELAPGDTDTAVALFFSSPAPFISSLRYESTESTDQEHF